jgi:hypothetical protein
MKLKNSQYKWNDTIIYILDPYKLVHIYSQSRTIHTVQNISHLTIWDRGIIKFHAYMQERKSETSEHHIGEKLFAAVVQSGPRF